MPESPLHQPRRDPPAERIVLVLQGGGALGAYQAGTYQALHEAGLEPDWVIGTSIGAINASLIAGNEPEDRLDRLRMFWSRMTYRSVDPLSALWPMNAQRIARWSIMATGLPHFFEPNLTAFWGMNWPTRPENAGYYSTAPLRSTLCDLVDFTRINGHGMRLTVGAANLSTGLMQYFDSREMPFTVEHIMASGALPPAFPAVRIDGDLFWDGGVLSNTPVEAVFDDNPRCSALIFAVHVWNPSGPEPTTISEIMTRQKELQYASRAKAHITRQKQIHKLRHVVAELVRRIPEDARQGNEIAELASYGCLTRMHIVRLLAPMLEGDDMSKDIDFTEAGIRGRWEAGYADTMRVIERAPWKDPVDPLEGFILHEAERGIVVETH